MIATWIFPWFWHFKFAYAHTSIIHLQRLKTKSNKRNILQGDQWAIERRWDRKNIKGKMKRKYNLHFDCWGASIFVFAIWGAPPFHQEWHKLVWTNCQIPFFPRRMSVYLRKLRLPLKWNSFAHHKMKREKGRRYRAWTPKISSNYHGSFTEGLRRVKWEGIQEAEVDPLYKKFLEY